MIISDIIEESNSSHLVIHISDLYFDIHPCKGCYKFQTAAMAQIPPSMFIGKKIRENMNKSWHKNLTIADSSANNTRKDDKKGSGSSSGSWGGRNGPNPWTKPFPKFNQQVLEHPPAKYNSKLMNSIWGLYNRYSVHNFKKIADDVFVFGQQNSSDRYNAGTNAVTVKTNMNPNTSTNNANGGNAQNAKAWETLLTAPEYRQ